MRDLIRRLVAQLLAAWISRTGVEELVHYLMNRRLIGRRSTVTLRGRRLEIDTYEVVETVIVEVGVLCFRRAMLRIYDEVNQRRTLVTESLLREEQVPCA